MTTARTILMLFMAAWLLNACGGPPPTYYYRFHPPAPQADAVTPLPVTIAVHPFGADILYQEDRIIYRESPLEVNYYHYRRWSAAPNKLVTEFVVDALQASGRFARIMQQPGTGAADYFLRGRIKSLEEWDEGRRFFGRVTIAFELIDPQTHAPVWQQTYHEQTPAGTRDPLAVVAAINTSLSKVVQQLEMSLYTHLDQ